MDKVMAENVLDLEIPVLLLAMPQVMDSFFSRSVVLLIHHIEEGSFGFIVNRPTEIQLADILQGMEMPWNGASGAMAFFGGPVQSQLGTVMFGHPDERKLEMQDPEGLTEVSPGICITQQLGDLGQLAATPPSRGRLRVGDAGWGAGQLALELSANAWLHAPATTSILFETPFEQRWEEAAALLGIDLATMSPEAGHA